MTNRIRMMLRCGAIALAGAAGMAAGEPGGEAPIVSTEAPVNIGQVVRRGALGDGFAWQKLNWQCFSEKDLDAARERNLALRQEVPYADAGLMQWVGAFYEDAKKRAAADPPQEWARQYVEWIDARPHYVALRDDGQPIGKGWVSPAMPLDEKDWPPGVPNATFADFSATRLTDFTARTGINSFSLADGWNAQAYVTAFRGDFNPRVVDAFARKIGVTIPEGTVPERAQYIREKYPTEWVEFTADAWARWMGRIVDLHREKTGGEEFLFTFQTAHDGVGADRARGIDHRLLLKYATPAHFISRIELQAEPARGLKHMALAGPKMAIFAAREPRFNTGVQISAPHNDPNPIKYDPAEEMSKAIDKKSGMTFASDDEKSELMHKFTKQHWLGVMWAHCATADGGIRRAAMSWHGNHGNKGRPPAPLWDLVTSRIPTAPFGPAVYYSTSIERALEREGRTWRMDWDIEKYANAGVTPVYGVSDLALDALKHRPSAFLTTELEKMSAEERKKLEAISPVYDFQRDSEIPLPMMVEGATGFGFVDQNGKTILVVARPLPQWEPRTSGDVTVRFRGLPDGTYTARDLIDYDDTFTFTISGGNGQLVIPLERWDSRALETTLPAPAN